MRLPRSMAAEEQKKKLHPLKLPLLPVHLPPPHPRRYQP